MQSAKMNYSYSSDESQQELVFDRHCHLWYEFIFVFDGNITINVEGVSRVVKNTMLMVIEPLKYHTVTANESGSYNRLVAQFNTDAIPEEIRTDFINAVKRDPVYCSKEISRAIDKIRECCNDTRLEPLAKSCLVQVIYSIALSHGNDSTEVDVVTSPIVSRVISYINDNLTEKISLEKIAANLFLSVSTVCHVFKREMKTTVKQYILQKKLSYAEELMRSGATAAYAGQAIGYYNYVNFYNAYKKLFGRAPTNGERG